MSEVASRALTDLLSPGLLSELRRIELKTRRSISSDVMGNYRTAFRGSGLVFSELREYFPGDDVKHIHWKVTARTGKAYVKSFEEDRQLRVMVAVDTSSSTDHGAGKTKHLKALEFAALIAMLAQQNHDAMGLCLFSDHIEEFIPPRQSRRQFQTLLLSILRHRELKRATNVAGALEHLRKNVRRSSVLFIVSDFIAPPFADELRGLSLRHDVVCVLLEDALDFESPRAGLVEFADAESGRRVLIDTSSAKTRRLIREHHERRVRGLAEICRNSGTDLIRVRDGTLQPLADLMKRRRARVR